MFGRIKGGHLNQFWEKNCNNLGWKRK